MDRWFDVTLRLPRILDLTDGEMREQFSMLDGRWSEQTQELTARHKAKGLTLNANWAFVRTWWMCPSCERRKPELVRLSPAGILLACLEAHHDHLGDWVDRAFTHRFGLPRALPREAFHIEASAKAITERFGPELICQDCNAADGQAKNQLKGELDPDFSFSPQEIRQFIRSAPNTPHVIDVTAAKTMWTQQKDDFAARKRLVGDLIDQAAAGRLRKDRTGTEQRAADLWLRSGYLLSKAFSEAMSLRPDSRWDGSAYRSFIARSTANHGAGTTVTRKKRAGQSASPTDVEYAALDSDLGRTTKPWRLAPADWRCPCCGRAKREICRKSNAGQWTARIFRHNEYVLETDYFVIDARRALYPAFIQHPIVSDEVRFTLCQDCASISAQLKAQRPELAERVYLSLDDVRASVLAVAPHTNHQRDLAIAAERALANAALVQAVDAFHEHRNLALQVRSRYRLARGSDYTDAEARAYAVMKVEKDRGLPQNTLDPFIDWLIDEGVRLDWQNTEATQGDNTESGD